MDEILIRAGLSAEWAAVLHLGFFGRILLAALLGGLIGLEREYSGKPAGLRTNMLICVGAAIFTELSISIATESNLRGAAAGLAQQHADSARIAAQIVTGIGFIGAGTILQSRGTVIGLTSAATVWVVAAIGMAAGSRAYAVAILSTAMVGIALGLMGKVETSIIQRIGRRHYFMDIEPDPALVATIEGLFLAEGMNVVGMSVDKHPDHYDVHCEIIGARPGHEKILSRLLGHPRVRAATRST